MPTPSGRQEHERYQNILKNLEQRNRLANEPDVQKRGAGLHHSIAHFHRSMKRGNRERMLSIVIPFSLILAFMLYIVSPFSKVNKIQVTGCDNLSAQQVKQAANLKSGNFIWRVFYQQAAVEKVARKNNLQINQLKIELTGPQSIRVVVKEYPIVGIVTNGSRSHYPLASGKKTAVSGDVTSFIQYQGFTKHAKQLTATTAQVGRISTAIRDGISEVVYSPSSDDPERLILYMNDGNTVYARISNLSTKMKYYPSIVKKMTDAGIVDLQYSAYSYSYNSKSE